MHQFDFKLYLLSTLAILLCHSVLPSSQCGKRFKPKRRSRRNSEDKEVCCIRFWGFGKICKRSCVGYVCSDDSDCAFREYCTLSRRCAPRVRSTYRPTTLRLKTIVNTSPTVQTVTPTRIVDKCSQDSDCATGKYCCIVDYSGSIENECKSSCVGHHCSPENSDCVGNEYCNSDHKCELATKPTIQIVTPTRDVDKCSKDSDCATGKYCCLVDWSGPGISQCKSSCVGDHCYEDSDCGLNEYCKSLQCELDTRPTVQIVTPTRDVDKCSKDLDCATGKYCCLVDWSGPGISQCKSSCVGDHCYEDSDCGLNEYCKSRQCELPTSKRTTAAIPVTTFKPNGCAKDSHCTSGKYCCIVDWTGPIEKECKSSCVGDHCYEDSDCGLNEYCKSLQCELDTRPTVQTVTPTRDADKCSQDSDCATGKYCCIVDWTGPIEKKCKSSCVGDLCYQDSDCGSSEYCNHDLQCKIGTTPTVQIVTPTRDVDKCSQDSDCAIGKYCCHVDWTGSGVWRCKSSCVGDVCYKNSECGLNEHCIDHKCELATKPTVQTVTPTRDVNKCSQDSDCTTGKYCCVVDWTGPIEKKCKSSCVGDYCYENSDCGLNESCSAKRQCGAT